MKLCEDFRKMEISLMNNSALRKSFEADERSAISNDGLQRPILVITYPSEDQKFSRRPGFDFREEKKNLLLHNFQTGFRAYPASYPVGSGNSLLEGKPAGA
jgi:hypothetical protein